jgi:hypothetical protein
MRELLPLGAMEKA